MSRLLLAALALGLLAAPAAPAGAAPLTPEGVLRAEERVGYRGTLRLSAGGTDRTVEVLRLPGGRARETYLSPTPPYRATDVVVADGTRRWHHDLVARRVDLAPAAPAPTAAQRLALLRANYDFRVLGQLRHLGRLTLLAEARPHHAGNLAWRLWIDQATQLPLVVERRDGTGALVDRAAFTAIAFDPRPPANAFAFRPPAGAAIAPAPTMLAQGPGGAPFPKGLAWRPLPPREPPPGYQLLAWQYYLDEGRVPTFAWRYHDGMALLSCFATDARSRPRDGGLAQPVIVAGHTAQASERRGTRMLAWTAGQTAYTLVGELPLALLQATAASTY